LECVGFEDTARTIVVLEQYDAVQNNGFVPNARRSPELTQLLFNSLQRGGPERQMEVLQDIAGALPASSRKNLSDILTWGSRGGGVDDVAVVADDRQLKNAVEAAIVRLKELRVQLVGASDQTNARCSLAFHPDMELSKLVPLLKQLALWGIVRSMVVTEYQEVRARTLRAVAANSSGEGSFDSEKRDTFEADLDSRVARTCMHIVSERQQTRMSWVNAVESMRLKQGGLNLASQNRRAGTGEGVGPRFLSREIEKERALHVGRVHAEIINTDLVLVLFMDNYVVRLIASLTSHSPVCASEVMWHTQMMLGCEFKNK